MTLLHKTLDRMGADADVAVCVKIETAQSLSCLPGLRGLFRLAFLVLISCLEDILLACLASNRPHSVMLARGDLAAEIGLETHICCFYYLIFV